MIADGPPQDALMDLIHRYQRGGLLLREIARRIDTDIVTIHRAVLRWLLYYE